MTNTKQIHFPNLSYIYASWLIQILATLSIFPGVFILFCDSSGAEKKKIFEKVFHKTKSSLLSTTATHHCIKCLISVLGRALFFYQDFHFDFLLQYSLSYCWEDRPVSKEKPRSIRCFFFIFVFFLTFGGWNFNHVAQKILIKRAFLRIFFFWDQLNFSLSGVFKRRAI